MDSNQLEELLRAALEAHAEDAPEGPTLQAVLAEARKASRPRPRILLLLTAAALVGIALTGTLITGIPVVGVKPFLLGTRTTPAPALATVRPSASPVQPTWWQDPCTLLTNREVVSTLQADRITARTPIAMTSPVPGNAGIAAAGHCLWDLAVPGYSRGQVTLIVQTMTNPTTAHSWMSGERARTAGTVGEYSPVAAIGDEAMQQSRPSGQGGLTFRVGATIVIIVAEYDPADPAPSVGQPEASRTLASLVAPRLSQTTASLAPTDLSAETSARMISPSGNIACGFGRADIANPATAVWVSCQARNADWHMTDPPLCAHGALGDEADLATGGSPSLGCHTDTIFGADLPVLAYGASVRYSDLSCTAANTGITCRNGVGHGFTVSVQTYAFF